MKRLILIAVFIISAFSASAIDGKAIYNKYSDAEDVSAVYISKAMFNLIKKLPSLKMGENSADIASVVQSLEGMYVIDSQNTGINQSIKKDVDRFVQSGKYEMLMEVKESGETVHIYTLGAGEIIDGIVLLSWDKGNCTFINLDGKMLKSKLEEVLANSSAE